MSGLYARSIDKLLECARALGTLTVPPLEEIADFQMAAEALAGLEDRPRPTPAHADAAAKWFERLQRVEKMGRSVTYYRVDETFLCLRGPRRDDSLNQIAETEVSTGKPIVKLDLGKDFAISLLKMVRRNCVQALSELGFETSGLKSDWDKGE